jgi:hypothetical protein
MITVPSCHKLENIRQLNKDIEAYYKNFCRRSEEYKGYLSRDNTVESQKFLTFSAFALARFILTADAIEDSLTSDNCSTNSSFFFLISELTFL